MRVHLVQMVETCPLPPLIAEAAADACRDICEANSDPRSQLGQALLEALYVCVTVVTLATGAALDKLHLHCKLAELEILAFLSQVDAATYWTVLRAQGCGAGHP